jgi:predicted nucleic acid-binding protein
MIDGVLDTSIVIDLLRQFQPAMQWASLVSKQNMVITPIVWMETVEGARNNVERSQILRFLRQFPIEHPIRDDNNWSMLQFAQFHLGHGVDLTDVIIAPVAVRLAVPLYTLNIKHYVPLPGVDERKPY